MRKQVMIIGLGQFGMALGRALVGHGVEVLGIDTDEERVTLGAMHLTETLCLDATEEAALGALAPASRDACVVAIGDHSRDASIICTALLTQLSAKRIIARANTDVHARILGLVGAHEVVNPEQAFGESFASRVMFAQIKALLPINDSHVIAEFGVPGAAIGIEFGKVDVFRRTGVSILGLRRPGRVRIDPPRPDERLRDGDMLIVMAPNGEVERVLEAFGERGEES